MKILLPQITEYKKQAQEAKKAKTTLAQVQRDYLAIEAQLKTFSIQNYKTLSNLYNQSDEVLLLELLQPQFNELKVKKLNVVHEQEILNTYYQITGYAPDTQSIEDFITWANTISYIAKVELPIKMEFDEKTRHIYFVMVVNLKTSTYKEHQIILDNKLRFDYFRP